MPLYEGSCAIILPLFLNRLTPFVRTPEGGFCAGEPVFNSSCIYLTSYKFSTDRFRLRLNSHNSYPVSSHTPLSKEMTPFLFYLFRFKSFHLYPTVLCGAWFAIKRSDKTATLAPVGHSNDMRNSLGYFLCC
jgi:hypothetical protein